MENKDKSISFLKLAGMGHTEKAFKEFIAPNFTHHNQYFKGTRDSLIEAMDKDHKSNPNISIQVKHSYSDKNTVITHSLVIKKDMQIAVIHIFRFEEGKIVELWDLGQPILEDSPNENGIF